MEPFIIKKKIIGEGKPLICVSIVETTSDEILARAKEAALKKIEMVEWRADFFEDVEVLKTTLILLKELKNIFKETIFLFTFRNVIEGGAKLLTCEQYAGLLNLAINSKCCDVVDIELKALEVPDLKKFISNAKKLGIRVLLSTHNFLKTPDDEEMKNYLDEMEKAQANIIKLAVTPQNTTDVFRIISVAENFRKNYKTPIIIISMGTKGLVSRLCAELYGFSVTFGYFGKSSASGQIAFDDLKKIIDSVHNSIMAGDDFDY